MTISRAPLAQIGLAAGVAAMLALAGCRSDERSNALATTQPAPRDYAVAMPVPPKPIRVAPPPALVASIAALNRQFGGKAGIAIKSVTSGWTVSSRGDIRLPQQSVSKLWVAITMLDLRDRGRLTLDDAITVTKADLTLFHQPVASLVKGDGYHTTVGALEKRALTMSDNTANDRILNFVGGPEAVRHMIARKMLGEIRFGPGERLLQARTAGLAWRQDYSMGRGFEAARARLPADVRLAAFNSYVADPIDGAAPDAIVDALARLVKGELLSPSSTRWLLDTMASSRTGRARLRAVLPDDWEIAHKTGTGQDLGRRTAGFNDVGILTAPDGRVYTVAVLIGDTDRPVRERQQLIQDVAQAIVTDDSNRSTMAVAQQAGANGSAGAAN